VRDYCWQLERCAGGGDTLMGGPDGGGWAPSPPPHTHTHTVDVVWWNLVSYCHKSLLCFGGSGLHALFLKRVS
jgi:hypothetical protein